MNADDQYISVAERFELYLMWQSNENFGALPKWVTIGKLEWDWGAGADNQGGNWTLDQQTVDFTSNPIGSASAVFPEWEGILQSSTWNPPF